MAVCVSVCVFVMAVCVSVCVCYGCLCECVCVCYGCVCVFVCLGKEAGRGVLNCEDFCPLFFSAHRLPLKSLETLQTGKSSIWGAAGQRGSLCGNTPLDEGEQRGSLRWEYSLIGRGAERQSALGILP